MPVVQEVSKCCTLCGTPAQLMCQRCLDLYCSIQCQAMDWPQHKRTCINMPPLVTVTNWPANIAQIPTPTVSTEVVQPVSSARSAVGHNLIPSRPMRPPLAADRKMDEQMMFTKPPPPIIKPPILPQKDLEAPKRPERKLPLPPAVAQPNSPLETAVQIPAIKPTSTGIATIVKPPVVEEAPKTTVVEAPIPEKPEILPPKHWLQSFVLDTAKSPIEIIVHFSEPNGTHIWVIQTEWASKCNELLRDINKYCIANPNARPGPDDIVVDNIFAVQFEGAYYRAIIVRLMNEGRVKVRLIDYGNEFTIEVDEMLLPNPKMKNLNAFAVRAQLKGVALPVQVESRYLVKVVGHDQATNVYQLELFEPEVSSVIEMFRPSKAGDSRSLVEGKITILAVPKKGLAIGVMGTVALKEPLEQLYKKLPEKCEQLPPAVNIKVGAIVCWKLDKWHRVRVVQKLEQYYVVYGLDAGFFEYIHGADKFKECPQEFAKIPAQAILLTVQEIVGGDEVEFYNKKCFPFAEMSFAMKDFDVEKGEIVCELSGEESVPLAVAKLSKFDGTLASLGLPLWTTIVPSGTEVSIVEVVDYQTLFVCPVDKCGVYNELFPKLAGTIPTYTNTPQAGDTVLANKEGYVFRGRVQLILSALKGRILDLETRSLCELEFRHAAPASALIKNLPVHTIMVKVAGVELLTIDDQVLVAKYLNVAMEKKLPLILTYDGSHRNGVRLLNATTKRNFLLDVRQMREEAAELPKPEVKGPRRFMVSELETREISTGDDIKLALVDYSGVEKGVLTVCEYRATNVLLYEQITQAVGSYGRAQANGDAYYPKKNELCVAIFPADNEWYRAVSQTDTSVDNPRAELLFVDYCNTETIDCKNVRPMTEDLMMGAVAHVARVEGLAKPISKSLIIKLIQWEQQGSFVAKSVTKKADEYVLTLNEV